MDVMKLEAAVQEADPVVRKGTPPRPEQAVKKDAPPVQPKPAAHEDTVDVKSMRETSRENTDLTARSGKVYDYTVNSSHDVIIKVKDMHTRKELKEIPSKPYQAAKRGYHKVVDKIIDQTA